ncbi:hypothetical protein [Natrinema salaciae]|uniref:Uncharacterized protein n=1 Tax=Natrinema salaciae TaxID=1186196 RepID=A0A1H9FRS5_9EURY|nr:hypothetical protein [Natrinema salaciae]SEQ40635.1 hypothetical protein SAMN04489841_1660 [Natrinema salaciae]
MANSEGRNWTTGRSQAGTVWSANMLQAIKSPEVSALLLLALLLFAFIAVGHRLGLW